MKILITGIAGFLGSHLAEHLTKAGHQVCGIDNFIGGDPSNIPKGIPYFIQDLDNLKEVERIFKTMKPQVVYHCACTAYEGFSVFSPSLVVRNTFQITANTLTAFIQNGGKRFIFCSSMSRYGDNSTPFTEDMNPSPQDPYAVAKVASEQLVAMMAETHGFEYVIAVPHNIIGPKQKYNDPYRNVAAIMINRILNGKSPVIYGDGLQTRCFSYIDDVLYSLLRMLDCPSGEVYNIGPDNKDGEVITIKDLAVKIAQHCGYTGEFEYYPDRPREVKHAYCSSEKIRRQFGYQTKTTLDEGVEKMVAYIKEKGICDFRYHLPIEIINNKTPLTWLEKKI